MTTASSPSSLLTLLDALLRPLVGPVVEEGSGEEGRIASEGSWDCFDVERSRRQSGQREETSSSQGSIQARWKACRPSQGNTRISSSGSKSSTQIGHVVVESGATGGAVESTMGAGEEGDGGESGRTIFVTIGPFESVVSSTIVACSAASRFLSSSPTLRITFPNPILSNSYSFLRSASSLLTLSSVPVPNLTTGNVSSIARVSPLVLLCPPSRPSWSSSDESPASDPSLRRRDRRPGNRGP